MTSGVRLPHNQTMESKVNKVPKETKRTKQTIPQVDGYRTVSLDVESELWRQTKMRAAAEVTTVREVVETALRNLLAGK